MKTAIQHWFSQYHEKILMLLILMMVCITRSSMAFGNFIYSLILVITIIFYWRMHHNIKVHSYFKIFLAGYAVMAASILPSVFASEDIGRSLIYFFNIWVWKALIVFPIVFFIKTKRYLYFMLTVFFVFMGIDSWSAFSQLLFGIHLDYRRAGGAFMGAGSVMGLAMLITFTFPIALITVYEKKFPDYVRLAAGFSVLSLFFGMWANQSRGSWLFNSISGSLISLRYSLKNWRYLIILFLIVGALGFALSQSTEHLQRLKSTFDVTTDSSNLGRIYVWEASKEMIVDHLVTGVGPGMWQSTYRKSYRLPEEVQDLGHTHNNILQVTAESGYIGLLGFMLFWLFILILLLRSYISHPNPYDICIIVGIISYIFLFGSIDYTWGNSSGIRIFWVIEAVFAQLRLIDLNGCRNGLSAEKM